MQPPVSTPSVSRNWGIDCLRGLSILLVVLNHLGLHFRLPLKKTVLAAWVPKQVLSAISYNGYEAVFVFFVISGFLISMGVLQRYGSLEAVQWRAFYLRRASRILPLLGGLVLVLAVLHWAGLPDYRIDAPGQSLGGALAATLGLYLNWYEGQTTWLPASWDVLWSLSIEELFYLIFPLVCIGLPRRALWLGLVVLALSLPYTKGALDGHEIWQEKAYWPGMAAIATGVLCALLAQRWPRLPHRTTSLLSVLGLVGLTSVLCFGSALWKLMGHHTMLVLTGSVAVVVLACHHACTRPQAPRGLGWLATMGRLSYEIYLSHMFVVLTVVAVYRNASVVDGVPDLRWCFLVYPPCIALTVLLGAAIERWVTQPSERWLRRTPPVTAPVPVGLRR